MPSVGSKKFSYDKKGKKAAKQESLKTGQPIRYMRHGGGVVGKNNKGNCGLFGKVK
jgi:hypothetical protein